MSNPVGSSTPHNSNLRRGRIRRRYSIRNKSNTNIRPVARNVAPYLRNKRNGTEIINHDVVKRRRIEPVGVSSCMPNNVSHSREHSPFTGEAIKKQFGLRHERFFDCPEEHILIAQALNLLVGLLIRMSVIRIAITGSNCNNQRGGRGRTNSPIIRRQYTDRNEDGKSRCVSLKYLEDLLKLDEESFVLRISTDMRRLNEFLDNINLTNNTYVLIIKLLKKIFDSRFPDSQQVLIQTILKERFVNNLQKYLGSLPMHDENQKFQNGFFWQNTDAFWTILIEVSRKALEILPNYASNILQKVVCALQVCIPSFEKHQKQHVSEEIKKELDELAKVLQATISRFEEDPVVIATHSKGGKKFIFENDEPPDDFRTISVYPDVSEILRGRSFVRPNVVDGPYRDVDHYLDVQFRLLREDFVNPLRCGVRSIQSGENKRYENVRVHKKIRFLHQETINEYHCIRLKFNFSGKPFNFNYENSKKFMFGTLLCFTPDNFATLKFARIVKRDHEDLMNDELVVGFDMPQQDLRYDHDYLMIECSVYFEPYFHVLTALKKIDKDEFAMKEYIVNVQTTNILPKYLQHHDTYKIDEQLFTINDLMNISGNIQGFDNSQTNAFRAALTREFSIIQGPPGTGKTYLGLKIAKTLLDNHEAWWESTPMLVICFTNHALDQFMEGLLSTTTNIVRIGGQSKNPALKTSHLSMLRKKSTQNSSCIVKNQVRCALNDLGSVTTEIKEIEQCIGVVSFQNLVEAVPGFYDIFSETDGSNFFVEWLLEGYQEQYFHGVEYRRNVNIDLTGNINSTCERDDGPENYFTDDTNAIAYYENYAEIFGSTKFRRSKPAITLEGMGQQIEMLRRDLQEMESGQEAWRYQFWHCDQTRDNLFQMEEKYKYLNKRLSEVRVAIRSHQFRTDINTENLAFISPDDRWALYTIWLIIYKRYLHQRAAILTQEFRGLYKQYEEVQNLEDTHLLRSKLVVGMTTTSAARLRSVLIGLRSPIVIVEEAAEVLEAHIITALTKHCQHLILIGDHKQLKPSSADYSITKDYKLGISLFERMVNNGIQCHTLDVQHRMRPEMSQLICPTIYPNLKDHESVFNRPPITGIDSPIQFIDHTHLEDDCDDNHTKKNLHEVKFAVALARHLILNGYKSEQITILTAYLGQMFAMFKERDKHGPIVKNVRIAALDNYQGEENDIIILSLVRSNEINKIGFLAIENRVCVALSRAKSGLYIIGNMKLLSSNSKIWRKVKNTLEQQNALGPDLTLRCKVHTNITTLVRKGEDFQKNSEGGCNQICKAELLCGHFCRSLCHIRNREHKYHQCREQCKRKLCDKYENHICLKKCFEKCGPCTYEVLKKLDCGHEVSLACNDDKCPEIVTTKLPCDHFVEKPCHADANTFECPKLCDVTVDPCGHSCTRKCHIRHDPDHLKYKCMKKCARPRLGCSLGTDPVDHLCPKLCHESCVPCNIIIGKQRTKCPHKNKVACRLDVDSIECKKLCTKKLSCGHQCKKQCCEPCTSSSCIVEVEKVLKVCEHTVVIKCNQEPNRDHCYELCPLKLPCGHSCTRKCNQVCTPECQVLVDCEVEAACGHVIVRMKCHDSTSGLAKNHKKLLANCSHPCNFKLKCGHQCSGTCGECLQGRFHKRCSEKCGIILICNHECRFSCREACRPCDQPCTYRCVHSVCKKKCGDICTRCTEPCQRRCKHQRCLRLCSSICSVSPCTKPCSKLRRCGHACIGFCGDPCPPKCLICDRKELLETEMLFGYESENSKFVLLLDCKHVIESEGMEQWLKMRDDLSAIGVKVCPKCKTPIKTTLRYSDHINRAIADVNKVKIKAAGSRREIYDTRQNLIKRIHTLKNRLESSIWKSSLEKLVQRLQPTYRERRQDGNIIQLTAIAAKLQLIEQVAEIMKNQGEMKSCPEYQQEIYDVLTRDVDYITNQEIEDVSRDLGRLLRAAQYERMKRSSQFTYCLTTNAETKQLTENIETALCRIGPYAEDAKLKSLLEELKKILGSRQGLSDIERSEIITAIGMRPGHWFKCPNGHVYAIGDCGGAMQVSKCNECGAQIGGTSHRLLATNALAPEMDGVRYPAYSEMANNMGNFMNLH